MSHTTVTLSLIWGPDVPALPQHPPAQKPTNPSAEPEGEPAEPIPGEDSDEAEPPADDRTPSDTLEARGRWGVGEGPARRP